MKSTVETFDVRNTMGGKEVAMAIRAEDTVHLMAVLTDLYKNRLLAVIREYLTNAWDAHVEAGVSLPVELTLPSGMSPSLVIRDFGCGLSADDIETIYSQYGRSTKRGSDEQVGMLGLGCKSALTYTTQFTVSSVKDGRRVTVLVSRKEDGAGTMQILGDPQGTPTDEANGTTVTVAIRREDHQRCADLAREFLSYWPVDSVLLNGQPPARFTDNSDVLKLSDTLYLRPHGKSLIVMGNVAYEHDIPLGVQSGAKLIAFVPIGAVRPTPSRESLMDTANTARAVQGIVQQFHATIERAIQDEVTNAPTARDAISALVKWEPYMPKNAAKDKVYTWQGNPLPEAFRLPAGPDTNHRGELIPNNIQKAPFRDYRRKSYTSYSQEVSVKNWNEHIWVEDFNVATFTAVHKNKLVKWARDHGFQGAHTYNVNSQSSVADFLLLPGKAPDSVFLDKNRVVPWETVKAIKLVPQATVIDGKVRIPGSYDIYTEDGFKAGTPGSDFRQDKPIIYAQGNRWANDRRNKALKLLYPEYTFVCLPENRIAKFKRDVVKALPIRQALADGYAEWVKKVDARDVLCLAMEDETGVGTYSCLDENAVNDPELAELIRVSKRDVTAMEAARNTFKYVINAAELNATFTDILDTRYPLYDCAYMPEQSEHIYAYLNMAYAMEQAKVTTP